MLRASTIIKIPWYIYYLKIVENFYSYVRIIILIIFVIINLITSIILKYNFETLNSS